MAERSRSRSRLTTPITETVAPGLVAGGGGVEQRERPEVGDVVHAAVALAPAPGEQLVGLAVDVDVERDRPRVLGVEAQRVVDRLQEQPVRAGEDRRDRVDQLGEVGHPHDPAVADEAVQVGGDRQRVGQVVALLDAALRGPRGCACGTRRSTRRRRCGSGARSAGRSGPARSARRRSGWPARPGATGRRSRSGRRCRCRGGCCGSRRSRPARRSRSRSQSLQPFWPQPIELDATDRSAS